MTGRRQTLRKRLFVMGDRAEDWYLDHQPDWWERMPVWVGDVPFTLNERAQRAACALLRHVPIGDQCGKPDHDFCAYCRTTLPGQASRNASDPREVAALAKHYGVSAESMRSFLDDDPDTSDDASAAQP